MKNVNKKEIEAMEKEVQRKYSIYNRMVNEHKGTGAGKFAREEFRAYRAYKEAEERLASAKNK